MGLDIVNVALVLAEAVNNQRFSTCSDLLNDLFQTTIGEDGHNGSKYFLPHQLTIFLWLFHNGRREMQLVLDDLSSI